MSWYFDQLHMRVVTSLLRCRVFKSDLIVLLHFNPLQFCTDLCSFNFWWRQCQSWGWRQNFRKFSSLNDFRGDDISITKNFQGILSLENFHGDDISITNIFRIFSSLKTFMTVFEHKLSGNSLPWTTKGSAQVPRPLWGCWQHQKMVRKHDYCPHLHLNLNIINPH